VIKSVRVLVSKKESLTHQNNFVSIVIEGLSETEGLFY